MRSKALVFIVAIIVATGTYLVGCSMSDFDHGSVRGTLVNAADGQPIVGANVFIGSEHGVTDATGTFGIFGILTGVRELAVIAPGYALPGEFIRVNIFKGVAELGTIGMVPDTDVPPDAPPAL